MIINFIPIVVFAVIILNLYNRVSRLENQVFLQGEQKPQVAGIPHIEMQSEKEASSAGLVQRPTEHVDRYPDISGKIVAWLKDDWMLKLGAGLLLIGFGWLTTYAIVNEWIGPAGQIALGIIAGALIMILGWWRINKYVHQGGVFLVLGSTTILLTVFAAREVYDFFDPFSALLIMFLSTAFVALVSVQHNNKVLSVASLALAGIAPFLTNAPTNDEFVLFSYLFVVVLGAIWVVVLTGQRELTTAALLLVGAYSLPVLGDLRHTDTGTLLLFIYAFAGIFFITNTIGIIKLKDKKEIVPDLVTAVGSGLLLLIWILMSAPKEWQSMIIVGWMFVFVVGAFLVHKATQQPEPFYVYAGVGVLFLAAATAVLLDGPALTLAYTVEVGVIVAVIYAIVKDVKMALKASLLLVVPMFLSVESFGSQKWLKGVLHDDFFVLFVLGAVLLGIGAFFMNKMRGIENKEVKNISGILIVLGSLYWYVLLWLSLHSMFMHEEAVAVFTALVVYTVIGLSCYFYGLVNHNVFVKFYGGALVGFVVARLLFVDVWDMALAGKIVTFFVIGTMLVSTAFIGRLKQHKETGHSVVGNTNNFQ